MTERIFHESAYILDFDARVTEIEPYNGNYAVTLDRTAFYPEGGGQPSDKGTINGAPVLDVIQKDGEILHILSDKPEDITVNCNVDYETRLDYTQQHSGQHVISACFIKLFDAETNSFHIGSESTTIEVRMAEFDKEKAAAIEDMANNIIYRNIPVTARFYNDKELAALPLRKQPKVSENIRVVEVQNFDYSPCGGTHVSFTGELGMIKIKKWEKCKDWHRIEFVCGKRALLDYRMKNASVNDIGAMLSLRDFEVSMGVEKLILEMQEIQKQNGEIKKELSEYISSDLMKDCTKIGSFNIISKIFSNKDINQAKHIAQNIINSPSYVVLFACIDEKAQVLFSKSDDVPLDMGKLLKNNISLIDGRGGGSPKSAQGGGNPERLEEFIEKVVEDIKAGI